METQSGDIDLRTLILETSRDMLVREGYAGLSMRKIAASIGYSATTIYHHFQSKDQLVHALIREGFRLLTADVTRAGMASASADAALQSMCRAYVLFGLGNPGYYEVMFSLHPETMSRYPAIDYREARGILDLAADLIRKGQRDGLFETGDCRVAANVLWFQMHGVVSLLYASRVDMSLDRQKLTEAAINAALAAVRLGVAESKAYG